MRSMRPQESYRKQGTHDTNIRIIDRATMKDITDIVDNMYCTGTTVVVHLQKTYNTDRIAIIET